MKKLFLTISFLVICSTCFATDKSITQLDAVTTPQSTDVYATENATDTYKITWANIVAAIKSALGITGITDSVSTTSSTTAASATAVKSAYDLAQSASQNTDADLTSLAGGITGIVKGLGNGNGYSAASAGTDYLAPTGSAAGLTNFPTLNQNTTGTAAGLSGTPTLPNGTTATTQTSSDSSTKLATTAFVHSVSSTGGGSYINVKDHSVTGDGTTDDTAAILAVIASYGAGTYYFPKGTYKISSEILITTAGIHLLGDGPNATFIVTNSATANIIKYYNSNASAKITGGSIRNMSLTTSVNRSAGYAIYGWDWEMLRIDNVRIFSYENLSSPTNVFPYTTGNGMFFRGCGLTFVTGVNIEIKGAFKGIHLSIGNDRYFSQMWIRGNYTDNSWGVYIEGSNGDWFTDVECVEFDTGVQIQDDVTSGTPARWIHMKNVLADTNKYDGFILTHTNYASCGIVFESCWASTNGHTSAGDYYSTGLGRGFLIYSCDGLILSNCRAMNNAADGLQFGAGATGVMVLGGIYSGNSQGGVNLYCGIKADSNTNYFSIQNTISAQSSGQPNYQRYGIYVGTGVNVFNISNNFVSPNYTANVYNMSSTGTTKIVSNNF